MQVLTRPQWNIVLLGALLLGSLYIALTRVQPQRAVLAGAPVTAPAADPAPLVDHPAPNFTLTTTEGETLTLGDLKGQVVLVNIWATWCPPCRAEMPTIQATYEQYRDQGFRVLAVNLQEDAPTVAAFFRSYGLTFAAPLDADGAVSSTYRANVLPSSFFVDRRGVIRAVYRGPMPRSVLDATVEQLLSEGT